MHEFTIVPRALFAVDGTMLHCSSNSTLMTLVEQEAAIVTPSNDLATASLECKEVDIVDGIMAWRCFNPLIRTTKFFNLLIIQSQYYDIPLSLKTATRVWRQRDQEPVSYTVLDTRPTSLRFR